MARTPYLPSSFSTLGTTVVFGVASFCEGHTAIWDGGMFLVSVIISISPLAVVGGSMMEIWVEAVPSQVNDLYEKQSNS